MHELAYGIAMILEVGSFLFGGVVFLGGYLLVKWLRSKWEIRKKTGGASS